MKQARESRRTRPRKSDKLGDSAPSVNELTKMGYGLQHSRKPGSFHQFHTGYATRTQIGGDDDDDDDDDGDEYLVGK
jgi:hypothetical protein